MEICGRISNKQRPIFQSSKQRQQQQQSSITNIDVKNGDENPEDKNESTKVDNSNDEQKLVRQQNRHLTIIDDVKIPKWKLSRQRFLDNLKQQRRKTATMLNENDRNEIIIILDNGNGNCNDNSSAKSMDNSCENCGQKFSNEVLSRHEIFCVQRRLKF
ncbi:hypothetical protein BLA29_009671 [Euroglyphus maynei]|uniref:Uncharacterized protein n=1 Tax=Euroglyphus maynei TaxID=6958 RepID=A0A1Y3B771_EURMA|nr:hypothetical protein BLA29_009671 [Euroglyphus maynei]